ncbi:MAG: amino acid adenylation domain-containing protein [Saccharofermentans sp.]|nr:amino acid adenylation domain-containing protein [Saccharofermentans sp.]
MTLKKWHRVENMTDKLIEDRLLTDGFLENVRRIPDKTALICEDDALSYRELYERACGVAMAIRSAGAVSGDKVAVSLPRGINMVCAVLGILLNGCCYVPVSPRQPEDRKKRIFNKAGIRLCVGSGDSLPDVEVIDIDTTGESTDFICADIPYDNSAYVIFTSGSTGEPKGVEISHSGAWNTISDVRDLTDMKEDDVCINISSLDFDLSVFDIFGTLSCGGTLVLLTDDTYKDPAVWKDNIMQHKVTFWNSVPALFEMLMLSMEKEDDIRSLHNVLLSGDYVMPGLYRMLNERNPECRFIALGGATEASIWSNYYIVDGSEDPNTHIPYGKPLANQQFCIVQDGEDVEDGQIGELFIGGKGLAKGYTGDPDKTAAAFVTDDDGKRWYRTGDTGYYREDGNIIFAGRSDDQVKLNGFRIELGEVENQINGIDRIRRAVSLVCDRNICAALEPDLYHAPLKKASTGMNVFDKTSVDGAVYSFIRSVTEKLNNRETAESMHPVLTLWKERLEDPSISFELTSDGRELLSLLKDKEELMLEIMTGHRRSVELLTDDVLSPERLMAMADTEGDLEKLADNIASRGRTDVIAFVSCREGILAASLLKRLEHKTKIGKIIYLESSTGLLDAARKNLDCFGIDISYVKTDGNHIAGELVSSCDCAISLGGIHLFDNITNGLDFIRTLLQENGMLFMTEPAVLTSAGLISAAVLEEGFVRYTDMRKGMCKPMLLPDEWNAVLGQACFENVTTEPFGGNEMFMYSARYKGASLPGNEILRKYCSERLVYYMVPEKFVYCVSFPLTANGKVDRRTLSSVFEEGSGRTGTLPLSSTEKALAGIWCELLKTDAVYREDNFFEIGGDSLLSTRLISAIKARFSSVCSMKEIFDSPHLTEMAELIESKDSDEDYEEGEL